ncbi:hypothetical protein STEG23_001495, partial [Scotinomys teguina]
MLDVDRPEYQSSPENIAGLHLTSSGHCNLYLFLPSKVPPKELEDVLLITVLPKQHQLASRSRGKTGMDAKDEHSVLQKPVTPRAHVTEQQRGRRSIQSLPFVFGKALQAAPGMGKGRGEKEQLDVVIQCK